MFYDTQYRHDQALAPDGLETIPAALHALNAAVDDCRRAGKPIARDAAVILLIANLADVAERTGAGVAALRLQCVADRAAVQAAPALLDIAGHDLGGDAIAKRTFHHQARHALTRLAETIGLEPGEMVIDTARGADCDDGVTALRHADIAVRVRPRSFLAHSEISFNRCVRGEPAGRVHHAPIGELLDPSVLSRRIVEVIGAVGHMPLAAAA